MIDFKNGIVFNVKKVCKEVRDERNVEANERLKCYYRMKINPKALTFPILNAFVPYFIFES